MRRSSSSNSEGQPKADYLHVSRVNKLSRDPLRRALLDALTRSAPVDTGEEVDDAS